MTRTTLPMFLIVALIATGFATNGHAQNANLTVRLDLSESVRAHLEKGTIKAIKVTAAHSDAKRPQERETKSDEVTFADLAAGKWSIRSFIVTEAATYVVDPHDVVEVDLQPGTPAERRLEVGSLMLAGKVTDHGKPFDGQVNLWPSEKKADAWGFTAPLDTEGRFLFPLHHPGNWDVRLVTQDRKISVILPDQQFRQLDTQHEIEVKVPEGAVRGRVVDAEGKGLTGIRVHASLERDSSARTARQSVVSGEEGAFALEPLASGSWVVKASDGSRGSEELRIEIAKGTSEDDVVLELK